MASTRMNSRRRPLVTCGDSAFAIAQKSCRKVQDLDLPIGSKAKRVLTTLGSPVSSLVCPLQHLLLTIFSYIDHCTLALEDKVEGVFPASKHVFNKVDEVVQGIENLPNKFDDVVDRIPEIIERVSFLHWALGQAISWLKLFTSLLTNWDAENAREKEIVVDTGFNESNVVSSTAAFDEANKRPLKSTSSLGLNNDETFPPVSENQKTNRSEKVGDKANKLKPSTTKGTYKEVLERRKGEDMEEKETQEDAKIDENPKGTTDIVKGEAKFDEESDKDGIELQNEAIIELIDSGWHLQNSVKNAIESPLPRSVSYD